MAPSTPPEPHLRAGLRLSDARFLLAWLLPGALLLNMLTGPTHVGWWTLGLLLAVAAIDTWAPGARQSPAPAAEGSAGARRLLWVLRLYVPLQLALIAVGAWAAAAPGAGWGQVAALAFAVGFAAGAQGITFAHELGHSKHQGDRALGWVLMASVNYSHFMVEHYRGHHPRAATHDDPASARRGESLWRFLPRTLVGSFASAWRLEAARLRQHGTTWLHSPLAWIFVSNVLLVHVLWTFFAIEIVAFWLGQSMVAVLLLETVNYVEHYGLQRRVAASGVREPFGVAHAWNADHLASNALLANLQRHSDHHMHAWKPFPTLAPLPGPQLPTGYAGCILLAAVPPLWFGLMHPQLDALAAQGQGAGGGGGVG